MSELALPADWLSKRLKYVATYNDEVLSEDTDEDQEIDYVEISGVSLSRGIEEIERVTFGQAPSRARRKVQCGDVLVSTVRTYLRAIAKVDSASPDLIASTGFCVVRPGNEVDSGFIGWAAKSEPFVSKVVARSVGVSYPAINASELVNIQVPLPPLETQRRIARFLDKKTAQIDGLIEKKRTLLERLAEKRQALITRAVTKGMNPDVPMKPSGIDWLGDIPAHWEVKQLRRVRRYLTSGSRDWAAYYSNEGDPFLRMTNVTGQGVELDLNDLRFVSLEGVTEGIRTSVLEGDILITITAELGSVAIVRKNIEGAYINQHLALFRPNAALCSSDFLVNFLSTDMARAQFMVSGQGGTKQGLGFEQVNNVVLGFPPREEQESIGRFCAEIWHKFQAAEQSLSLTVESLTEYRAALIMAAVTGKLGGINGD